MTDYIAGTKTVETKQSYDTQIKSLKGIVFLLSVTCGFIIANLYYAQPLIDQMCKALSLKPEAAGLIVTFSQLGYVLGMLFIVPLADFLENRFIIIALIGILVIGLINIAMSNTSTQLLIATFFVGLSAVSVQIVNVYTSYLVPVEIRGQTVGNIYSGIMIGIMLSRPVSSFFAQLFTWNSIFYISAGAMLVLGIVIRHVLPTRAPATITSDTYTALIKSMGRLIINTDVLRRRSIYQACLFGSFSVFWTIIPIVLARAPFNFTQGDIGLFALAGVTGAFAAPIAGRLADKGLSKIATGIAMIMVLVSFLITEISIVSHIVRIVILFIAAILIDFGATTNVVVGQRALFTLGPEVRSRLNSIYMATIFSGGAIGSALGGWAFAKGGWDFTVILGSAFPIIAFMYLLTEKKYQE